MATQQKTQRLLRISVLVRRRQGISEEEFQKYWTEKHAPLVTDWLARYGIVRYNQYHTPSSVREQLSAAWPDAKSNKTLTHDGTAEVWVRDPADFARAHKDQYYLEHVSPDEGKFFDPENFQWTAGWEEVYIEGAKVIEAQRGDSHYVELGGHGGDEGVGAEHLGERQ